jgi:hypothetical protein
VIIYIYKVSIYFIRIEFLRFWLFLTVFDAVWCSLMLLYVSSVTINNNVRTHYYHPPLDTRHVPLVLSDYLLPTYDVSPTAASLIVCLHKPTDTFSITVTNQSRILCI